MSLGSRRSAAVALLCMISAGALLGQSRPLNPTVRVLPRATAIVPADCEDGAAPQPMPRVQVEEIPREPDVRADMQVPPGRDLRDTLREAQGAAEANDRERFKRSLAAARDMVATYPPGGERNAAAESVAVLSDADKLWEYQFSSPTGAFFDAGAENGSLLATMNKYRGYEDFVRRQVIVDKNGNRFYPTRESRDFLLRESAQRLARLGVRTGTTPVARATTPQQPRVDSPRNVPAPATATAPRREPTVATTTPRTTERPRVSTSAPRKRTTRTASGSPPRKKSSLRASTQRRRNAGTPASSEPADRRPSDQTLVAPPPVTGEPSDPDPVTSTVANETIAPITDTVAAGTGSATTTTAGEDARTAATTTGTPATRSRSRNIVMPLVLILIGVGVLIVLFRATS